MTQKLDEIWKAMLAQSFHPSQWFTRDDDSEQTEPSKDTTFMWVYRETAKGVYTVGFYTPEKVWVPDIDYPTKEEAANRVSYLNGRGIQVNTGPVHEAAKRGFAGG